MIAAYDSSFAKPTPDLISQAKAEGAGMWNGYLTSTGHDDFGIASAWTQEEFELARQLGATPIGYCSGNDNPAALRLLADSWNVKLCLDIEASIRPDGPWVQPWVDASDATRTGIYGNAGVHKGRSAAFHVMAWYVSNPGRTWPQGEPQPATPLGWQYAGSVNRLGISVDLSWFDNWFGQQSGGGLTSAELDQVKQWLETDRQQWVGGFVTVVCAMAGITAKNPDGTPNARFQQIADYVQNLVETGQANTVDAIQSMLAATGPPADMAAVVAKMGQQHGA